MSSLYDNAQELQRLQPVLEAQREAYGKAPYPSLQERREHLTRLETMLRNNIDAIVEALNTDFGGRSADETKIAEILTSLEVMKYYRNRYKKWVKRERRSTGFMGFPGEASVLHQPFGVVGIIVPRN